MNELILKIENLNLAAGGHELFKNFNLAVSPKEIIGFFAPTGSGKTTLFNYIADHAHPEQNAVPELVEGLPVSYVFQEPRLIPSQTVLKNVTLPLENKMDKAAANATATTWLEKLNMLHKINDSAKTLSGGEQQRTAIARAFAHLEAGGLLLLDEPFAAQDENNIQNIITLIKQLIVQKSCSCLVICHDRTLLEQLCSKIITKDMFIS